MGDIGNIQGVLMRPIGAMLALAILFSAVTLLTNGTNSWLLATEDAAKVSDAGERISRIVAAANTVTDPDDAWFENTLVEVTTAAGTGGTDMAANRYVRLGKGTGTTVSLKENNGITLAASKADDTLGFIATLNYFTQNGTKITPAQVAALKWHEAESFWSASGLKQLITLILKAAALGIPVGAMFALAMFGKNFVSGLGVNPLIATILLIIGFLLLGSLLDLLTPFIGEAFDSVNSNRYDVYDGQGLSAIAKIIGNFYGVVVVGGILYVGWQVIGVFRGAASGGGGLFGGAGSGGGYGRM